MSTEGHCDLISQLPEHILASILCYLPIKEAARTCILSKQWKHTWLFLPILNLDSSLGIQSAAEAAAWALQKNIVSPELINIDKWYSTAIVILTRRLLHRLHDSITLSLCAITCPVLPEFFPIRPVLDLLAYVGVKCLSITGDSGTHLLPVPFEIFSFTLLKGLRLVKCWVYPPPPSYNGEMIDALRELNLSCVRMTQSSFDLLMSACVSLETLVLNGIHGLQRLVVRSSRLSTLRVYGFRRPLSICLGEATCLATFSLDLACLLPDSQGRTGTKLIGLLKDICRVRNLKLQYVPQSHQDENQVPAKREWFRLPPCLPPKYHLLNLNNLNLVLSLDDLELVQILSCLLRSAPNLQSLTIENKGYGIVSEVDGQFWTKQQVAECMQNNLSSVSLRNVSLSSRAVVGFIKYILQKSRSLKRMTVAYTESPVECPSIGQDLQCKNWASDHTALHLIPSSK